MVERLRAATDQHTAADEITQEYIELTVAEAVDDLAQPGAGDFFGRIDEETGGPRWYVGRRHIEDEAHEPVVIDWRATVAAPFYRATVADALGIAFRRRFTLTDGELVAYLDEHLDDPHAVAGGIPDPVLAEMGAARTGAMREIVATIQGEQDRVIRSPLEGCLVVQGGPGTGETAVGLHRAAFLLFEHRRRLGREGVLVVGPNRVFLDYVANVLPSLGERSVQQRAWLELAVPKVPVTAQDEPALARLKGDARLATVIERAALGAVSRPDAEVRVPVGARSVAFVPEETARWIEAGLASRRPLNRRREGFRLLARQEVVRRTGRDDAWSRATALRQVLDAAWPLLQPRALVTRLLTDADGLAAAADGILDAEEQALLLRPNGAPRGPTPISCWSRRPTVCSTGRPRRSATWSSTRPRTCRTSPCA